MAKKGKKEEAADEKKDDPAAKAREEARPDNLARVGGRRQPAAATV